MRDVARPCRRCSAHRFGGALAQAGRCWACRPHIPLQVAAAIDGTLICLTQPRPPTVIQTFLVSGVFRLVRSMPPLCEDCFAPLRRRAESRLFPDPRWISSSVRFDPQPSVDNGELARAYPYPFKQRTHATSANLRRPLRVTARPPKTCFLVLATSWFVF